ncbi:hypothetical protein PVAND_016520 [Polypedilum vanderplanki]|uniref:Elongation of very long chain fatty acids protein n=1 Tax=Polypedilum vanderplanki TaxID=319348 RepID=A0A9J6BG14_POLVA|nr:hypothetical protein PVAND_016520 [Polypedilum vanderplanki]
MNSTTAMDLSNILSLDWKGKYFYVDLFPLMGSPYPMLLIFISYLIFVLFIGPMWMKNRPPYNLLEVLRLYNAFQVCACTFIVVRAHLVHHYSFFTFSKCVLSPKPVGPNDVLSVTQIAFHIDTYLFMHLRLLELIETIFFVLRKKFNQVSALHMYHHISTITLCWIFLKYRGGRMEIFIAVLNSYVHIIMYAYYFVSSFKRYRIITDKIKPFITIMQIVQLNFILVQCVAILLCEESFINYILVGNFVINIVLFTHFFVKAYMCKRKIRVPVDSNGNIEGFKKNAILNVHGIKSEC